ncbi:aldo/keto reductase [Nocardioides sp. URHA0032]|uniref:aldo/keto reductase n=1 Tax=Nocardioides sp. URHA0032 TaxID=1380388 RepID=UPI00048C26BA|nr:aldo/keto reductase [Nocardioides sp. URHA0032]
MAGLVADRDLGSTGLRVSCLGLGSSPFRHGGARDWAPLVERAAGLGITYYDTARSYVNGEDVIAHLPPRVRDQMVVTTKTGARGGQHVLRDLQTSLRTLDRDRVDVWMTHMVRTVEEYEMCRDLGGFADVAAAAKQAGIVRASGASFHADTELILRAIEEETFDVVMFPLNVIGRETVIGSSIDSYTTRLLPAARAHGVGVVVMKVLAGGELHHGATKLDFLADPETGRDEIGGAVRYATLVPGVTTAVVGMASTDELERNVAAATSGQETEETAVGWRRRVAEMSTSPCTRCGDCIGACPEDIEIPQIFRLLEQAVDYGMRGTASYKYAGLDVLGSACTGCGRCVRACPEDFDVGAALHAAHRELAPTT